MKNSIKSQLFGSLRLESADVDVEVTEADLPEENIEGESSVAEAIEDVELGEEVDDIDDEGEDLEDAAEGLEELDVAVESFRNGGKTLSLIESAALTLTTSQVMARFVKNTDGLIPAVESFKADPEEATRLAHEGLKESAKTFGEGVVAAVKKALERLKEIISAIITRFRGIEARANKVIVAAKAIKGSIDGEIDVKKDSISVGGSASYEDIKDGFHRFNQAVFKTKDAKEVTAYIDCILAVNEGDGEIKFEKIFEEQNRFMVESFKHVFGDVETKDDTLISKPFPGEYRAKLITSSDAKHLNYEEFTREQAKEKGGEAKVEALQPTEIISIASAAKELQKEIAQYDGFMKRVLAAIKRINAITVGDSERIEDLRESRKTDKERQKAISNNAYTALRRQMVYYSKLVSASNDISGNMLSLCEKSIALAKKDAGEEQQQQKEEPKKEEV